MTALIAALRQAQEALARTQLFGGLPGSEAMHVADALDAVNSALAAAESPTPASDPLTVECVTCGHEALSHMDGSTGEIIECWHMQGGRNRCTCRKFVPDRLSQIPTLDLDAIDDEARWLIDTSAVPSTIVFARRTRTLVSELRRLRSQPAPASALAASPIRCTGISASWCPIHGDCLCKTERGANAHDNPNCPLHGTDSNHADHPGHCPEDCANCAEETEVAQDGERLREAVRALVECEHANLGAALAYGARWEVCADCGAVARLGESWRPAVLVEKLEAALSPTDGRNKL